MILLYAQPYDISAQGFYFGTIEEYDANFSSVKNSYGSPVEELELQFIDGQRIDAKLFEELKPHQGNIAAFLQAVANWDDHEKIKVIVALDGGHDFVLGEDTPDLFDIDFYEIDSLRDLAMQFVEEGLFGPIPETIQCYLDYDAMARDLSMDYVEISIDMRRYVYRRH